MNPLAAFLDSDTGEDPEDVLERLKHHGKVFSSLYEQFLLSRDRAKTLPGGWVKWVRINETVLQVRQGVMAVGKALDIGNDFMGSVFGQTVFDSMPEFAVNYMRTSLVGMIHAQNLMRSFIEEVEKRA